MTAFNVVRFTVKPGRENDFVEAHRKMRAAFTGFLNGSLVKTGQRTFCFVGEWRGFRNIETARPQMIAFLDGVREMLEDLGNGLGVTDPVSGDVVAKLKPVARKAAKKSKPKAASKPARKRAKKVTGKR